MPCLGIPKIQENYDQLKTTQKKKKKQGDPTHYHIDFKGRSLIPWILFFFFYFHLLLLIVTKGNET
jgi:hypothetical protein